VDLKAQSLSIAATEIFLKEQGIVNQAYLAYWDSRPYPYYPENCRTWTDCKAWELSPAINGKIGEFMIETSGCVSEQEL
jgi:hypothetical protein